jgi:hypothetical protein
LRGGQPPTRGSLGAQERSIPPHAEVSADSLVYDETVEFFTKTQAFVHGSFEVRGKSSSPYTEVSTRALFHDENREICSGG